MQIPGQSLAWDGWPFLPNSQLGKTPRISFCDMSLTPAHLVTSQRCSRVNKNSSTVLTPLQTLPPHSLSRIFLWRIFPGFSRCPVPLSQGWHRAEGLPVVSRRALVPAVPRAEGAAGCSRRSHGAGAASAPDSGDLGAATPSGPSSSCRAGIHPRAAALPWQGFRGAGKSSEL